MTLRISTASEEGVYQASKWLKLQVLCDGDELSSLFRELAPFFIFPLAGIVDGKAIAPEAFLAEYGRWIEELKQGRVPADADLRKILACALTDDLSALWLQQAGRGFLTKIGKPIVQVQAHFFTYSRADEVFRPMSMGQGSIFWGLQFSFPQIYQDPKTMELLETEGNALFRKIQLWVRNKTRATPFFVDGKKMNSPIRIGKNCLSWIGSHPQLIEQKIGIAEGAHAH